MEVFPVIIKYLEVKDILCKLMLLSKEVRNQVMGENYLIFKKFLRLFRLSNRMKSSDMPAYVDVFRLIKENLQVE